VVSENKIWIVKNRYPEVDFTKKENLNATTDCLTLVNDIEDSMTQNKIDELNDIKSLEDINRKTDKGLTNIYEKYEFDSWIIPIE